MNERLSPHPVPLPLGEGTLSHAPCVVFEAVLLTQRTFSQGEKDRMRGDTDVMLAPMLLRGAGAAAKLNPAIFGRSD